MLKANRKTRFGVRSVERTPFFWRHYVYLWRRGAARSPPTCIFHILNGHYQSLGAFQVEREFLVQECAKSTKVLVISALAEASAIRRQLRACLRHSLGSPGIGTIPLADCLLSTPHGVSPVPSVRPRVCRAKLLRGLAIRQRCRVGAANPPAFLCSGGIG